MVSIYAVALNSIAELDPELQWVATEMAALHCSSQRAAGQPITVRSLAHSYCPHVAALVAERMGATDDTAQLSAAEACRFGTDALVALDPKHELGYSARIDLAARFVAAAAKQRAESPLLPTAPAMDEYWPFGQEGGFCNPNKLSDMQ